MTVQLTEVAVDAASPRRYVVGPIYVDPERVNYIRDRGRADFLEGGERTVAQLVFRDGSTVDVEGPATDIAVWLTQARADQ